MEIWRGKNNKKNDTSQQRKFFESWQWTVSDMEPEDNYFFTDGDDFVIKNNGEDDLLRWTSVFVCFAFCENGPESVCLLNHPPFQQDFYFVAKTTAYSLLQKQP